MGIISNIQSQDAINQDKDKLVHKLTQQLVQSNEMNDRLVEENRAAVGARKAAVDRIRELEDTLRLKERLMEDLDRQLESAQTRNDVLAIDLAVKDNELAAIRFERESHPLSDLDLQFRHERQSDLFENLQEALTCPICYSPFSRGEAISLLCGHTFCQPCFSSWEARHLDAFKNSTQTGVYSGPDCPECRSKDVKKGKVRIWALEEAIRLVAKGVEQSAKQFVPPQPTDSQPTGSAPEPEAVKAIELNQDEGEIAMLLRPRTPTPYVGQA